MLVNITNFHGYVFICSVKSKDLPSVELIREPYNLSILGNKSKQVWPEIEGHNLWSTRSVELFAKNADKK